MAPLKIEFQKKQSFKRDLVNFLNILILNFQDGFGEATFPQHFFLKEGRKYKKVGLKAIQGKGKSCRNGFSVVKKSILLENCKQVPNFWVKRFF